MNIIVYIASFGSIGVGVHSLILRTLVIDKKKIELLIGSFWKDSISWENITRIGVHYYYRSPEIMWSIILEGRTENNKKKLWIYDAFSPELLEEIYQVIEGHLKDQPQITLEKHYAKERKKH